MSKKRFSFLHLPFQLRLIGVFLLTSLLSLVMSLLLNQNIVRSLNSINTIYTSNNTINEMYSTIEALHTSLQTYLESKSTDSLNQYYYYAQLYRDEIDNLDTRILSSGSMEKNIYNISKDYLEIAEQAVEAKRARNTVQYRARYNEADLRYQYLTSYIYSLNNQQFLHNSQNYQSLASSFTLLQRINTLMIIAAALFNIILIILLVRQITKPLINLAAASDQVASGHFDVELPPARSSDELGSVIHAFNEMVRNLKIYIEQVRSSMEAQQKAQERELLMETHLKDAQLRYYQAQINPHFLFNSLNAGAQMAIMEDAEKTYTFIQNMAAFFRYSLKSRQTDVYLPEEIELVENYLAIMNVRFAGDIHYTKQINCDISNVQVPCMILQPIVENALQYGLRNIEWESLLTLAIDPEKDHIRICIHDNGCGISAERLAEIRSGQIITQNEDGNSNGVGLGNVQERLKLYYNEDHLFSIDSPGIDQGTTVIIHIPLKEDESHV